MVPVKIAGRDIKLPVTPWDAARVADGSPQWGQLLEMATTELEDKDFQALLKAFRSVRRVWSLTDSLPHLCASSYDANAKINESCDLATTAPPNARALNTLSRSLLWRRAGRQASN